MTKYPDTYNEPAGPCLKLCSEEANELLEQDLWTSPEALKEIFSRWAMEAGRRAVWAERLHRRDDGQRAITNLAARLERGFGYYFGYQFELKGINRELQSFAHDLREHEDFVDSQIRVSPFSLSRQSGLAVGVC